MSVRLRLTLPMLVVWAACTSAGPSVPPSSVSTAAPSPSPGLTYVATPWTAVAPLGVPRAHLGAVALGGAIYAIGGQLPATIGSACSTAVERYDAALNAWTRSPDLPGATDHAAVTASAASIFVFGGNFAAPSAVSYRFEIATSTWTAVTKLPEPRAAGGAAALGDRIYVVGGFGTDRRELPQAYAYDPLGDRYERIPDLPTPREHLAVVAYRGAVCAIGGHFGNADQTTLVECYDPVVRRWSSLPPLPRRASDFDAGVVGDEIWAVGDDVQVFDGSRWSLGPRLPTPRFGVAAAVLGRALYVIGGAARTQASPGVVERLDHP